MKENKITEQGGQLPAKKGFKYYAAGVVHCIETYLIILLGTIVGYLVNAIVGFIEGAVGASASYAKMAAIYVPFIGIWIFYVLYCIILKKERPFGKLYTTKLSGNNIVFALIGLAMGFVQNGACILSAYLHNDIELKLSGINLIGLLPMFIFVFFQSSAEEITARGYLMYKVERHYGNKVLAVLISSLFFGACHLGNNGVTALAITNICLTGLLYALIVQYTDSLWCVFCAHAAWNFTQNIIFGLPNSGMASEYAIFTLNEETARNSFFYNVDFGVESTGFATIVLGLSCIAVFLLRKKIACKEKFDIFNS